MSPDYGAKIETASVSVATFLGVGFSLSAIYNLFVGKSLNELLDSVRNL